MTFFLHESFEPNGAYELPDQVDIFYARPAESIREEFHILREKLSIPQIEGLIHRPRINHILRKSQKQFPATLISGRAGTGKTALAVHFAAQYERVSWYTVEATDTEWPVFSSYFSASLDEERSTMMNGSRHSASENDIARFLLRSFSPAYALPGSGPQLLVLDDIHHIFDAGWFGDFFHLLLYSLPPNTHLLLLCRSKPPSPLWRLRSKQMLDVIDEKVIAFDLIETVSLFATLGRSAADAAEAHRECFGRVSKLLEFAKN